MAKWVFYVLVFVYMCYRAVYGAKPPVPAVVSVDQIIYGEDGYLEVDARQTVNCKASNRNQKLEWVDPSGNVIKRISSNRVYAQEHFVTSPKAGRFPGLVLTFTKLLVSDSGLYQCKSGDQTKSVPVCVIKPSQFVDTPAEVSIEAGRSISLTCQAKGDPEPRLIWQRDGAELTEADKNSKYMVNRKYNSQGYESLLTITSLTPDDAGLYNCVSIQESPMIDNCTHSDTYNITLQVEHAPVFNTANHTKSAYGKVNDVVNLNCKAGGWPKPTYRWFKDIDGDELHEFEKSKIIFSEDPHTASLPVTAGPTTFGNTYKCVASNSYGEAEKYFQLKKREKPWRADSVDKMYATGTGIYFNVTWNDKIDFPVDSFDIQYIEKSKIDGKSYWQRADISTDEIDEDSIDELLEAGFGETVLLTKLEGLKSETTYLVRLRARNAAGEAAWSDAVTVDTDSQSENTEEEEDEESVTEADESDPKSEPDTAVNSDSGMFYGIFFAGGILIVAVVCMFAMRLV